MLSFGRLVSFVFRERSYKSFWGKLGARVRLSEEEEEEEEEAEFFRELNCGPLITTHV